ncbi:MAG: HEAT repeat domain-containing protein [Candidatus Heimdallarchaeota archaeon]|nr:HEAT repeat domain-containing protein [Candidatus Heimdallarchaeota archaeon]
MGAIKKTVDDYISELVDWDDTTREEAAKALGEIGDEIVIDPLLQALKEDESEDVRASAALALGKFDNYEGIPQKLGEIISQETSPIVRIAIANSIGEIGNKSAAKLLIPVLENEESFWVREAIIEALGKAYSKDFTELLLKYLKDDDSEEVRVQAANALIKNPHDEILDNILQAFKQEESDEVKSHIAELIAEIPNIKSVEVLTEALENEDYKQTQAAAAEALYKIALKLGYNDENEMMDSL